MAVGGAARIKAIETYADTADRTTALAVGTHRGVTWIDARPIGLIAVVAFRAIHVRTRVFHTVAARRFQWSALRVVEQVTVEPKGARELARAAW